MSEPFLGEIRAVGFSFAPRGWAFCDGSLLPIAQYTALFSILGTTYGGDGRTNFALPNLMGKAALGPGHGPGLSSYQLGQHGGVTDVTLAENQLASHQHVPGCASTTATAGTPGGNVWATGAGQRGQSFYADAAGSAPAMAAEALRNTGGGGAHNNMPPYLGLNFVIALEGLYPSRS